MTLQVQQLQVVDVADLVELEGVEDLGTGAESVEVVEGAGGIDQDPLVPVPAVGLDQADGAAGIAHSRMTAARRLGWRQPQKMAVGSRSISASRSLTFTDGARRS